MVSDIIWRKYKGVLIPFNAPHVKIELDEKLKKKLLIDNSTWVLKWVSNWDKYDSADYYYVIIDIYSDLVDYSANTRNQIRKGIKECYVKKVTNEYILNNGYSVYSKAYFKYNQRTPNFETFNKVYGSQLGKSEFFSVFDRASDLMIGFAETQVKDNACIYGSIRLDPDYLKKYSSYVLIHTMNEYYLRECGLKYVSDGAKNLVHDTNIQEFLIQKFNFRKVYCKLNLYYRFPLNYLVKIMYPVRNFLKSIKYSKIQAIYILLLHEEIRRSYE